MGNAERLGTEQPGTTAIARRTGLEVPADWFVDPADPQAAERLEHGKTLEDQATAFLAAHEEAERRSVGNASAGTSSSVTALSEAPSRRTEAPTRELPGRETAAPETRPADSSRTTWLGLPALVPTDEIEGELAWQVDALCAQTDPEAFFPEKGGSTRDAKKVCGACNVKQECLEYALGNDERFGIWGGLSERERRKLRKRAL
ncbi:WhiB family transcriptional regulator [Nesterenkonia sp. LB17]|uniref:WhiB family transcriptional regulator n=1 Tax=unclassified Nesterenkonia TaxID=2629769 RepID=UPI001F4D071D|nr:MULTISPECIES: WhiB family transcriptional regulator [unclassified Nesterenkonia]MCH8560187.1 WhiB family transcriptional regulator [Nesterenkonia sp. DZ6]MCH8565567.1 WhiB family transcriptional regulator [Nesterenkonia sp. LB17]